jgi:hypothetical protein
VEQTVEAHRGCEPSRVPHGGEVVRLSLVPSATTRLEGLGQFGKNFVDLIGNRSHDLPNCRLGPGLASRHNA